MIKTEIDKQKKNMEKDTLIDKKKISKIENKQKLANKKSNETKINKKN